MTLKMDAYKKREQKIDEEYRQGMALLSLDLKKALALSHQSLAASIKIGYVLGEANSYILKGSCESLMNERPSAIVSANTALELAKKLGDKSVEIAAYHILGNVYSKMGDLDTALSQYLEGLELSRQIHGDLTMNLLNNISVVYSKMNQLEHALTFLKEALSLSLVKPSNFLGFLYANIAEVLFKLDRIDEAYEHAQLALQSLQQYSDNSHYFIQCNKALAKIYSRRGQTEEAFNAFGMAIELCHRIGDQYRLSSLQMELGVFYHQQGHLEQAHAQLTEAFQTANKISADVEAKNIAHRLSQVEEQLGHYETALFYMKHYLSLSEKINTKALETKLLNQAIAFEVAQAKKDAEIERLKHEDMKRIAENEVLRANLLAETLKDIQLISAIGQTITASLNMKTVLKMVYKQINKIMQVDVIGICLYDKIREEIAFKLMMRSGKKAPLHQVSLHDEASIAARCIREKTMLYESDLEHAPMKSVIFVPLIVQDEVIGALTLQSLQPHAFSDRSIQMILALSAFIAIGLKNSLQSETLEVKSKALEITSQTDSLTGLYNRRYMISKLTEEQQDAAQLNRPYAIAILDVDHFKKINDQYGHICGDAMLQQLAKHLKQSLREDDILARWGGEEFLILFPEVSADQAMVIANRLCQTVSEKKFQYRRKQIPMTITLGLASSDTINDSTALIQNADKALYKGKTSGRNLALLFNQEMNG